jgi:hypothetical protein
MIRLNEMGVSSQLSRPRVSSVLVRLIVVLCVCFLTTNSADAAKRVALVIGNGAYRVLPTLANPINDARDIGETLRKLGFETIIATDLDRAGMNDALDRFSRVTAGAEMAFVYYSGHGMQFQGANYLLPVDVKLDSAQDVNRFRLMPVEDILEVLKSASGATLLLLDACRSNPVEDELKRRLASLPGANRDAVTTRGFTRIGAGSGLIIAYATQANDVASDGFGRNSPFAKSFLKFAPIPDLDLRQMLFRVQDDVDRETNHKQRPELSISLIGEYTLSSAATKIVEFPKPSAVLQKPAVSDEEIAWPFLRNTTDVAALREFVNQFPAGKHRSEADNRIAELVSATQQKSVKSDTSPPGKVAMLTEGAVRPARPRSEGESCADRDTASGTDHYCASSRLPGQFGNSYGVRNLFSGDSSLAWVEGAPGDGIGEWITVEFDSRRSVRSVLIDNGYQKNSDIYYKNSRVKRVRLMFSSGESLVRPLDDRFGTQSITLGRAINAYWVQIVVEDIYRGVHSDTAITKLLVNTEREQ